MKNYDAGIVVGLVILFFGMIVGQKAKEAEPYTMNEYCGSRLNDGRVSVHECRIIEGLDLGDDEGVE